VLIPSDGGKFEVFLDGVQLYSKLQTGTFPEPREIAKAIEKAGKR